jgi:hypothetical protein
MADIKWDPPPSTVLTALYLAIMLRGPMTTTPPSGEQPVNSFAAFA